MRDRQMRNMERWFRLWTVLLGRGRPTLADLVRKFGVSRRTIYRDLDALERMGVPVVRDGGRYCVDDTYTVRPVQFTPEEVHALFVAMDFAQRRKSLGAAVATRALEKLLAVMPASNQEIAAGLDDVIVVDPWQAQSRDDPAIERALRAALQGHHPLCIRHTALGRSEATERVVRPYGLAYRGTGLYLIGHCELKNEVRSFRVNRISAAQVLPATFARPADFDLETLLAQVWGIEGGPEMEVRIRFSPPVVRLATETQWHPTQRLEPQPEGSVDLLMRTRGRNELARWLAGYGGTVEVLAPPELRQTVIELGQGILRRYA